MLTHLTINNFMLIDHLDLDLKHGMTAITGETGTGKSILLGALALTLGERADGEKVRLGCDRTDITATFLLDDIPNARQWLIEHDLSHADECLLRRVVTKEGRSRAFINSQPVPLQQVKALGEHLIDIHSQHAHQALLSKGNHQRLLDDYAQHSPLVTQVKNHYEQWQALNEQYLLLRNNADEINARYQLLRYQVDELDQLDLQEGELAKLEAEQQTLANAENILGKCQQLVDICDGEEQGLHLMLNHSLSVLQSIRPQTDALGSASELLNNALIQVEEAQHSIREQIDTTSVDPERLQEVDTRLSLIYDIARKHHIKPESIPSTHQELAEELQQLSGGDEALVILEQQTKDAEAAYYKLAKKLSSQRVKNAQVLTQTINQQLDNLAMSSANFVVSVKAQADKPTRSGIDDIEFLISTNPGQSHKPLAKVVSGGELSRISLAIQVATAQTSHVASLVFDEVDVGIGGETAEVVGKLLAELGKSSQVFCITHLAQVASKASQHLQVSKRIDSETAETQLKELNEENKVEEIARMISGKELTDESFAHARTMMKQA
jgi:DNA repair protein RecN (Recombination protein N)